MAKLQTKGHRIVSVDFETTGLLPGWHEPIQLAAVPLGNDLRPLAGIAPFYSLIRPEHLERASPVAMAIHKIPPDDLLAAPSADDVGEAFADWGRRLGMRVGGQMIPLAHPWSFEYGFFNSWLGPDLLATLFTRDARDTRLAATTLNDYAALRGKPAPFRDISLDALCRQFKIVNAQPHDALWDAICEAEVYRCILETVI